MKKLFILLIVLLPSIGMCLGPGEKSALLSEMHYLLYRSPHIIYKWGGADIYKTRQADCSGTWAAVVSKLSWPGHPRTTAIEMEKGREHCWKNRPVALDDVEETTFIWWTWPVDDSLKLRRHGHVGVCMISPKSKLMEVVHNNKSKGLHIEPIKGVLLDDISSIKNLTYGEKVSPTLGPGVKQIK